jgi:hypothetical protein
VEKNCFITLVVTKEESRYARLMICSLREFGGEYHDCPVWIFTFEPEVISDAFKDLSNLQVIQLDSEPGFSNYFFGKKVIACAQAERMSRSENLSLIWLNPECLVIKPPRDLDISNHFRAAFRPVHIQNIGSAVNQPLDPYWQNIYDEVGIIDPGFEIESYVDGKHLRPYFNTHLFAVDVSVGLMQAWLDSFSNLITNEAFQKTYCRDQLHRIFLHQAILSALLVKMLAPGDIHILPPDYSYPLHLHDQISELYRAKSLNELVIAVYEDDDSHPLNAGIEIDQALNSWLVKNSALS